MESAEPNETGNWRRLAVWLLIALALIYAFLSGLRTVYEPDLGWQLAAGRWIVQNHHVPSADVFSYTARGREWIYPALSEIILYLTYQAGGYALISWLSAAACVLTVFLLISRRNALATVLAILAVPLIADRTAPRAEMFTTVLFAAFVWLLWRYFQRSRGPLWLLPVLMLLWVNLHLGFVAGIAICVGYVLLEIGELPFLDRRRAALQRLRDAAPWLIAAVLASFLNPWGPKTYLALERQNQVMSTHALWIAEWSPVRLSIASLKRALDWNDPQGALLWLVGICALATVIAIWQRRFGVACWLAAASVLVLRHVRLKGLFASVVVVIGGSVFSEALAWWKERSASLRQPVQLRRSLEGIACALLVLFVVWQSWALVTNRSYLRRTDASLFGSGVSWWYPERAAAFVQSKHLPGNIFNDYGLGGYLIWRLNGYPDYLDGRAIPFPPELFYRAYQLTQEEPDSAEWTREADERGINVLVASIARYDGLTNFPRLLQFCTSRNWTPVYLDEVSAVFLRNRPDNQAMAADLRIDCSQARFEPPVGLDPATRRGRAELFQYYANAGAVLYALHRLPESLTYLDRAQKIFAENSSVFFMRAQVLKALGRLPESERELWRAVQLEPTEFTWAALGQLYVNEGRYADAVGALSQAAQLSSHPPGIYLSLAEVYLYLRDSGSALNAFKQAGKSSPYESGPPELAAEFHAQIAEGEARAWYLRGDGGRALDRQLRAVQLTPNSRDRWLQLAELYTLQNRATDAREAQRRADLASRP